MVYLLMCSLLVFFRTRDASSWTLGSIAFAPPSGSANTFDDLVSVVPANATIINAQITQIESFKIYIYSKKRIICRRMNDLNIVN